MKAVLRWGNALLAAALALAPAAVLAQAAPSSNSPPQSEAIGPGSLQNFSLSGTVTRPADQQPVQPAPKKAPVPAPAKQSSAPVSQRSADRVATAAAPTPLQNEAGRAVPTHPRVAAQRRAPPVASEVSTPVKIDSTTAGGPAPARPTPAEVPSFAPAPQQLPPAPVPGHSLILLPWLLAALAFGAGGAVLFWRNRVRQALPAAPAFDLFGAAGAVAEPSPSPEAMPPPSPKAGVPEPLFDLLVPKPSTDAPRPTASPTPPTGRPEPIPVGAGAVAEALTRTPPATSRVVSTGLRPWVEIGFQPLRCVLEDRHARIEFEIELFNSGSSPARSVLVEAIIVSAGPTQDEQIGAFFERPAGPGERLLVIPPLKRVTIKNMVVAPIDQVYAYELGGRQLFIPLIVFKALYRWSGGEGQTAVSYLLGRDSKSEKLAPFRLDLGPRIFRNLAARLLPTGVRD